MRLLKLSMKGSPLFRNDEFSIDLFAADRVAKDDYGKPVQDVTRVGGAGSIYSQNVIGLSGVNASGKTTALNLFKFVLGYLSGSYDARYFHGSDTRLGKLSDIVFISVVFFHEGCYYLLDSELRRVIAVDDSSRGTARPSQETLRFTNETLWELPRGTRVSRALLSSVDEFRAQSAVMLRRYGDSDDDTALSAEARMFLNDETSIASMVTGKTAETVRSPERQLPTITMPTAVIRAFDPSVEHLLWDAESEVYHLKFFGEPERVLGPDAAFRVLSRGTIFGSELVEHAIRVLSHGGYFVVDEIEEALNRSLVEAVINLFASPITNPRGAQLVFSTHYPELLDLIHRKDNVYLLVRDDAYKTELVKYSDRVKRIENKKSEAILSNYIRGSMPRYPDVQAMREYVRSRVNG